MVCVLMKKLEGEKHGFREYPSTMEDLENNQLQYEVPRKYPATMYVPVWDTNMRSICNYPTKARCPSNGADQQLHWNGLLLQLHARAAELFLCRDLSVERHQSKPVLQLPLNCHLWIWGAVSPCWRKQTNTYRSNSYSLTLAGAPLDALWGLWKKHVDLNLVSCMVTV
jgi:hypothetical protein